MGAQITIKYDEDDEDMVFNVEAFSLVIVQFTNPDDDGEDHVPSRKRQNSYIFGMNEAEAVGYTLWAHEIALDNLHRGDFDLGEEDE